LEDVKVNKLKMDTFASNRFPTDTPERRRRKEERKEKDRKSVV